MKVKGLPKNQKVFEPDGNKCQKHGVIQNTVVLY